MNLARSGKLVAFVATTRPEISRAFYGDVLGLELRSDNQFALVFDSNGTTVRVVKVREFTPAPFTVLGWEVENITVTVDTLTSAGVEFQRYDGMPQDERGICAFPGGRVAWFKDPDGNLLSVSQPS